jgi:hypothetical protein
MYLNKNKKELLRKFITISTLQMNKRLSGTEVELIDKKEIGEALAIAQGFLHLENKGLLEQLKLDFDGNSK